MTLAMLIKSSGEFKDTKFSIQTVFNFHNLFKIDISVVKETNKSTHEAIYACNFLGRTFN